MQHPIIKNIPDPNVQRAVAEMFEPGYTFRYSGDLRYVDPDAPTFPPQPMHLETIMAAYLDRTPGGHLGVRRQEVGIGTVSEAPAEKIVSVYRELIEPYQQAAPLLSQSADAGHVFDEYGGMQDYYMDTVLSEGRKLIAAHVTGRLASNDAWVSALGYPKTIHTEIPLRMRDAVVPVLNQIAEIRKTFDDPYLKEMEERAKPLVRLDVVTKELGAVAAASFLPTPDELAAYYAQFR